ncbi:MAG TPA: hypothetical protein VJT09_07555, partial [Pyrinomonadaceae bacterium]|nr:hypothetical protein [Pyrinomonadaceae bacterium]
WNLLKERDSEMLRAQEKRMRDVMAPIREDIHKSLEQFVMVRGITLLLDSSKTACVVGCDKQATAALDITEEFITEYNRLNP